MYLMFGDEADAEEGRGRDFVDQAEVGRCTSASRSSGRTPGSRKAETLKFASKTRPAAVSMDAHRDVKRVMIALAEELGVTFCAYVILHAIGRAQNVDDLVQYGANTALGKFNECLAGKS